jgi:uncharacterized membrane protein
MTFASTDTFALLCLAGVAVAALLSIVAYFRSVRRSPIALGLRLLGLALLAFCALEPHWTSQRVRPGANAFAILADDSQSLKIVDQSTNRPRSEWLQDALNEAKQPWLASLKENFDTRRFHFSDKLSATADFGLMSFQGSSSALGAALQGLSTRFQNRPLAGVVLLTDGVVTDLPILENMSGKLPAIYPVIIGGDGPKVDLALGDITVTQSAFEDAPITLQSSLQARGSAGKTVEIKLMNESGEVEHTETVNAPADGVAQPLRYELKPKKHGVAFYKLTATFTEAPLAALEATLSNNTRLIATDRGQGPYRILYLAGRPNWEYKFLNRALAEDPQIKLTAIIRVAKREPKFEFRGRAGEDSNPLFRGFADQSREVAGSYDKPVLVRLNTEDETELRAGFPSTREELFPWHAVILDDVEAEFFTPAQQTLLEQFVSERGGALLMLGGMECFGEGGYTRTPIGDLLPVYLNNAAEMATAAAPGPLQYELDREGWLAPWARLHRTEEREKERLAAMPTFEVLNRVRRIKPAASTIATVRTTRGETVPALVVQRFGAGRSAALTVGDFWRWGMRDEARHRDMAKAWRQLARWLVTDTPQRVSLSCEDSSAGGCRLTTSVKDRKWQPVDTATVQLSITTAFEEKPTPLTLPATSSVEKPGTFEAQFVPRQTAAYRAVAEVTNAQGGKEGTSETGWVEDQAAAEFADLKPNLAAMERLAQRTGGKVLAVENLDDWAKSLQLEKAPIMETVSKPLWHTPWLFLLVLGLFCAEWGWRRTHGLP